VLCYFLLWERHVFLNKNKQLSATADEQTKDGR
jgi:hypothetical protein